MQQMTLKWGSNCYKRHNWSDYQNLNVDCDYSILSIVNLIILKK